MKRILFTLTLAALLGTLLGVSYVGFQAGRYLQASQDQRLAVAHACGTYDRKAEFRWQEPEQVQLLEAALDVPAFLPLPTKKPRR